MGWHREVAGMIEKYGSFRLESHDAERMIESDELEAENTALRTALGDSTELLRLALCMPDGEAYGFVEQIAANEAALMKGSET